MVELGVHVTGNKIIESLQVNAVTEGGMWSKMEKVKEYQLKWKQILQHCKNVIESSRPRNEPLSLTLLFRIMHRTRYIVNYLSSEYGNGCFKKNKTKIITFVETKRAIINTWNNSG